MTSAIFFIFCLSFSLILLLLIREYRRLLKDIDHLNEKLHVKRDLVDKLEIENNYLTQRNQVLRKEAFRAEVFSDEMTFNDEMTVPSTVSRHDFKLLQDEITSIKDLLKSQL